MLEPLTNSSAPCVSIGIPVYNGENYLSEAIESILSQTFGDFELIICDNASEDRTREICEDYARRDERIRYFRNPSNLGAGPNYDLCFEKARGKYFKWAAHDDMLREDFLEKTVTLMEDRQDAVLCVFTVRHINWKGETMEFKDIGLTDIFSDRPSIRFRSIFRPQTFHYVFGLFKRSALIGSQMHGEFIGSDIVLLSELALRGPFIKCSEPLFIHRRHPERYCATALKNPAQAAMWLSARNSKRHAYRRLVFVPKLVQAIRRSSKPGVERNNCYRFVLDFVMQKHTRTELFYDILWFIHPKLSRWVRRRYP
jgi:glycosyltransferase involved in cell wall biosynthesis